MKRLMMKTIIDYQNDEREKVLLDVRDKQEFEKETYPGARNWYWEELIKVLEETPEEFTQQFDKSVPIYLLCYTGLHSDDLADILEEMGYEVYSLYGGWGAYMKWKFENYVKEAQAENELSGEERVKEIERSIVKKFRKPIWRKFTQALNEYDLIQDGDKIAVCISGGKDSMLMAKLFQELKRHGKNNFELVFLVMNPGYNDINYQVIADLGHDIAQGLGEDDIHHGLYVAHADSLGPLGLAGVNGEDAAADRLSHVGAGIDGDHQKGGVSMLSVCPHEKRISV